MTNEEAKRILHPDTTLEALTEIEYYAGFRGEQAKREAVDEACKVACEALEKRIPKAPVMWYDGYADGEPAVDDYECPSCGAVYNFDDDGKHRFCPNCGQALEWSE